MTPRPPRVCGDVSRPAAIAHSLRRRRRIIVLAELVLSPRVLIALGVIVALAVLGIWRNLAPANPCSPGYHDSTASLVYTAGPCIDTGNQWYRNEPSTCVPAPGVRPHPAAFSAASCVKNGGSR